MNYKSIVAVAVAVSAVVLIGCVCGGKGAKSTEAGDGTFTDSRDGKTYKTVKIGTAVWMAENLNFAADGSKCYENNAGNCEKYGRLYNWATAMKACPAGYRLPSDDEWTALVNYAGGEDKAGKKLKSAAGWNEDGNGTNDFGFTAVPGGGGSSDGGFNDAGNFGYWWSATEGNANYAWGRLMYYDLEGVGRGSDDKTGLLSVRCVKDGSGSTETATAQAAETPKGDDGSVDFEKLTQKDDVYYLNNKPYTGTAIHEKETFEMKDGKLHGKYEGDLGVIIHGTFKEGKKHGEWQYFKKEQLRKTETWENDKLIKEWEKEDEEAQNEEAKMIDFDKLVLKGDVYYLNNKPFTGKAIRDGRSIYEMKDGRFHGRCEESDGPEVSVGNYKNGKKDGEWEITVYGDFDTPSVEIEIWEDGKLIKKWTKQEGYIAPREYQDEK